MQTQPVAPWLALIGRSTDHAPDWLLYAGCGTSLPMCHDSCWRTSLSFNYPGVSCPLPARSCLRAVGKRYTAQDHPLTDAMTPYLVLTACAASVLLVCAQEVVPAPSSLSTRRSLRPAERLQPTEHPCAREPRRRDDMALPQAHLLGRRCGKRMNQCPSVSSDRMAGRRDAIFSGSG